MDRPRKQIIGGLLIMIGSLAAFFWWGLAFETFGRRIEANFATVGHFGWIVAGIFGLGFTHGGWRAGIKAATGILLAFAGAALLGVALGNY